MNSKNTYTFVPPPKCRPLNTAKITRTVFLLVLSIFTIFFYSCGDGLFGSDDVVIKTYDADSWRDTGNRYPGKGRSVFRAPDDADGEGFYYKVSLERGRSLYEKEIPEGSIVEMSNIPVGTWKVTCRAYHADGSIVAMGSAEALIEAGVTTTVEVELKNCPVVTFILDADGNSYSQTVEFGGRVTKLENPTKSGFVFAGWYVDANYTTEFDFNTVVTEDTTLYAKWVTVYQVNIITEGDHGTVTADKTTVIPGDTVTLTVSPSDGYELSRISVNIVGGSSVNVTPVINGRTYTFTMPEGNVSVQASFSAIEYSVTIANGITHGEVTSNILSAAAGTTITLTVTPSSGYELATLSVINEGNEIATTAGSEENTYTFVMPAGDVTVRATFVQEMLAMVDVARNTVTITGKTNTDNFAGVFTNGRNVTLSPYKMCKYEVTQGVYAEYMEGENINGKALASDPSYCKENGTYPLVSGDTQNLRPVEGVTWYDAVYFCNVLTEKTLGADKKVYTITNPSVDDSNGHITRATVTMDMTKTGYRLPTEAEWEFAARGGDTTAADWDYTFSGHAKTDGTSHTNGKNSGLDSVGWYYWNTGNGGVTGGSEPSSGSQGNGTHQIGRKSSNRLGIYDMSGNVGEWCWDWYNDSVGTGNVTDPVGASSGSSRVSRGGSWNLSANNCSVAYRGDDCDPMLRSYWSGFRLVRSISE